jgi:NIMA (never in mitosis gene a)-related kinase
MNVSILLNKEMAYTQTGTPYYASPEVWNNDPYSY